MKTFKQINPRGSMNKGWYLKDDESAIRLTLERDDLVNEYLDFTAEELEEMLYTLKNPSPDDKLKRVTT